MTAEGLFYAQIVDISNTQEHRLLKRLPRAARLALGTKVDETIQLVGPVEGKGGGVSGLSPTKERALEKGTKRADQLKTFYPGGKYKVRVSRF